MSYPSDTCVVVTVYQMSSWRCSWFENCAWNPWGRLHCRGRHRDTGGGPAPCRRSLTGEARGGSYWDASPGMQAPVRGTREYTVTPLPCLWWDRHGPKQRALSASDSAVSACALRWPLDQWNPGAHAGKVARACPGESVPRRLASLLARLSGGSPSWMRFRVARPFLVATWHSRVNLRL